MFNPTLILILSSLAFASGSSSEKIPNFRLDDLNGRSTLFSELQGEQLTVIDFWATWCGPCLNSLPDLANLSKEFSDQGVAFVGVNVDSPRNLAKVKPFAKSIGIPYPVLLDLNSEVMGQLNVTAMPTLLIVNSEREILFLHEGYRPGDDELVREKLDQLLGDS